MDFIDDVDCTLCALAGVCFGSETIVPGFVFFGLAGVLDGFLSVLSEESVRSLSSMSDDIDALECQTMVHVTLELFPRL